MLQPKLKIDSKSADGGLVVLKDTTGDYSEENPGGYGGVNPSRAGFNGVLLATLNTYGDFIPVPSEVSPSGTSPLSVSAWDVRLARDGAYSFLFVLAPQHDYTQLYPAGKIVYGNKGLYLSLQPTVPHKEAGDFEEEVQGTSLTDPAYWQRIDRFEQYPLFALNTGAHFALKEYLHTIYSDLYISVKMLDFAGNLSENIHRNKELRDYIYRDSLSKAVGYACRQCNHTWGGYFLDELHRLSSTDRTVCR